MTLGTCIREARQRAGLTLADVARHLGVTVSYLSHIEHDRARPSDAVLGTLSVVLSIPPDDLYVAARRIDQRTIDYICARPALIRLVRQWPRNGAAGGAGCP